MTRASDSSRGLYYARGVVAVLAGSFALSFTGVFFHMVEEASGW